VAVAGALGRMGRLTVETVRNSPDMHYVGGFARLAEPREEIYSDVDELFTGAKPDVLVDFTPRPVSQHLARTAIEHGVIPIVGSSEWNDAEREEIAALCDASSMGALIVPNFAIGAVLMMRFAEQAARFFPTIEIVELHRAEKRDKPSGTAAATAARIKANGGPADVPIHSVRLQGLLAHQEVLCGGAGELLTIRHDSLSRESFAAGILFAIRNVRDLKGLHVGLDRIISGALGEQ
jgi:4-hydroxy-tetrahydrodipicolinate reductase